MVKNSFFFNIKHLFGSMKTPCHYYFLRITHNCTLFFKSVFVSTQFNLFLWYIIVTKNELKKIWNMYLHKLKKNIPLKLIVQARGYHDPRRHFLVLSRL